MTTREITFRDAINEALREEMMREEGVFIIGEDIYGGPGGYQGAFKVTKGLEKDFRDRLLDTPMIEQTIVGAAVGAAMTGSRPVAEIMFEDFITLAMDLLVNTAAKTHYMTAGQYCVPIVVRAACGAVGVGPQHSQTWTSWFMHIPGLYVVLPSTPYDAKGLLKTAIRDDNPVIFLEPKRVYRAARGEVPDGDYTVELGQASVVREGLDVTVAAYGAMLHNCLEAAEQSEEEEGISCEVVDLRTLMPFDVETVLSSVRKTGRLVIVHEAPRTCGFGAELAATVGEKALLHLQAPVTRITGFDTPFPYAREEDYLPGIERIRNGFREIVEF